MLSTTQVGARSLETAVWGAYYNVKINMNDVTDETFQKEVRAVRSILFGDESDPA